MPDPTSVPFTLPLGRILEDCHLGIRISYGDLDGFAVQLMIEGQREPLEVRRQDGEYFLVDGHRRQRALARSLQLRIEREDGKFVVYEGTHPLRESTAPARPGFDPSRVPCRLADPARSVESLCADQILSGRGKPFTALERGLFLARVLRGGPDRESWALKAGFTAAHIAHARALHPADPRLIEQVREGRLSPALAVRILRSLPPEEQVPRLRAARAAAERQGRDRVLARDFAWADEPDDGEPAEGDADPVHTRLRELVARLGDAARYAPNRAAEERLGTLLLIHRYTVGQIGYERVEAHLLGRQ